MIQKNKNKNKNIGSALLIVLVFSSIISFGIIICLKMASLQYKMTELYKKCVFDKIEEYKYSNQKKIEIVKWHKDNQVYRLDRLNINNVFENKFEPVLILDSVQWVYYRQWVRQEEGEEVGCYDYKIKNNNKNFYYRICDVLLLE